jgi:hypothetical protein
MYTISEAELDALSVYITARAITMSIASIISGLGGGFFIDHLLGVNLPVLGTNLPPGFTMLVLSLVAISLLIVASLYQSRIDKIFDQVKGLNTPKLGTLMD